MLGNNILYSLGIHKLQIRLCFSVCTDCSNAFELDYFLHFHLVEPIFSEDLEAGFPKLFALELNWVFHFVLQSIGVHKICLARLFFSFWIFQA